MVLSSGIVLPGDRPLILVQVAEGLFVAQNPYERDLGFFSRSPLYQKVPLVSAAGADSKTPEQTPLTSR